MFINKTFKFKLSCTMLNQFANLMQSFYTNTEKKYVLQHILIKKYVFFIYHLLFYYLPLKKVAKNSKIVSDKLSIVNCLISFLYKNFRIRHLIQLSLRIWTTNVKIFYTGSIGVVIAYIFHKFSCSFQIKPTKLLST